MYTDISRISKTVADLKRKHDTDDPFSLCSELGVLLFVRNLGMGETAVKGCFRVLNRQKIILLNECLSTRVQRIVLAHELGHAVLHKGNELHTFSRVLWKQEVSETERQANFFAGELLLDDCEVDEMLRDGYTIYEVASKMDVTPEIILYKMKAMEETGYRFNTPVSEIKIDCMKNIEGAYNPDEWWS